MCILLEDTPSHFSSVQTVEGQLVEQGFYLIIVFTMASMHMTVATVSISLHFHYNGVAQSQSIVDFGSGSLYEFCTRKKAGYAVGIVKRQIEFDMADGMEGICWN